MMKIENSIIDADSLIEMRRNAYIECTENYLTSNTVVGIFGDEMPEELFYACGTIPVPIEGVDSHIFKFANKEECESFCDVIKSTLTYLTTQKCPILFSAKMYVLQDVCKKFVEALKANTEKKVEVFKTREKLIKVLCDTYSTQYSAKLETDAKQDLDYIRYVLKKIKYHSNLDTRTYFLLEFYSKYMTDLKMRRKYFEELEKKLSFSKKKNEVTEVYAICPRGNYENICKEINSNTFRITRQWKASDYGYAHCPLICKKEIGY